MRLRHDRIDTRNKKYIKPLIFLLVVAALSVGVLAAYVNQAYKKGVASTTKVNTLFSSNYLDLWNPDSGVEKEKQYVILSTTDESDTVQIVLRIKNYYSENQNKVCQYDINYDLTIKLEGSPTSGADKYQVNYQEKSTDSATPITKQTDANIWETTGSLRKSNISENLITITMPKADLGKVTFDVLAQPKNTRITNGYSLAGILMPFEEGTMQAFSYEGHFTDENTGTMPYNYDAFNYEVSISTGQAKVTLSWDNTKVEIDPYFIQGLPEKERTITATGSTSSVTFIMDVATQGTEHVIFYRKSKPNESDSWQSTWEESKKVITVEATEIAGTTAVTP